jgi:hypothetical protein
VSAFVLVHSPLVGPSTWRPVASELRHRGYPAVVPELSPLADVAPPFLATQCAEVVAAVRGSAHGGDVGLILAGHSGAGPRLPAIGDALLRAGFPIAAFVFVDAGLPAAGRTARETAPDGFRALLDRLTDASGRLPPWTEWFGPDAMASLVPDPAARAAFVDAGRPIPAAFFDEPVAVPTGWPNGIRCGYVNFTYDGDADVAEAHGWPVVRLGGGHLDLLNEPAATTEAMLRVSGVEPA